MAKATDKTTDKSTANPAGTELAARANTEVGQVLDYGADAGAGMEGATDDSFAIPFLSILQKTSPQVDEADGKYIEGAKSGMLYDNVSNKTYDAAVTAGRPAPAGIDLIQCGYKRVFVRWGAREAGGGFKGELTEAQVADMRSKGQLVDFEGRMLVPLPDGTINPKKCDRVADTRNHYMLMLTPEGGVKQTVVSLVSTQIKKSKALMSALSDIKLSGPSGVYTPPTFATIIHATTIPEQNDKGSWMGWRFEIKGRVERSEVYNEARAFNLVVRKGNVAARYEDTGGDEPAPAAGF